MARVQNNKVSTVHVRTDDALVICTKYRHDSERAELVEVFRDALFRTQRASGRFGRVIEIPSEVYQKVVELVPIHRF